MKLNGLKGIVDVIDKNNNLLMICAALLLSGCLGWERPDSLGGKRIVEFTNSSGVSVDCDWTGDGQRKWPSQQLPNNGRQHHDGPVADGIVLTWLDANRQPVVSIPGIRYILLHIGSDDIV